MPSFRLQLLNGTMPLTGTCVCACERRRRSNPAVTGIVVALLCLFLVPPSLGEVSVEMVQSVEDAAEQLQSKFQEIRTDILGADVIAVRFSVYIRVCAVQIHAVQRARFGVI